MRLHKGAIPEDPDFDPLAEGWRGIREPGPLTLQFMAIPVALLTLVVVVLILPILSPDLRALLSDGVTLRLGIERSGSLLPGLAGVIATVLLYIGGMALIILLHEVIHALLMPGYGLSDRTLIAVWPEKLLFYAYHSDAMPRNQYLLVFLGPLIVLTGLPLALIALLAQIPGTLTAQTWLAVIALLNAVSACGDIIGFGLVAFQIPARAIIRNKGWKSYWKPV